MRILRGLSSRVLTCGCLAGVYETYDTDVVAIIDARGPGCRDAAHEPGRTLPLDAMRDMAGAQGRASEHQPPSL